MPFRPVAFHGAPRAEPAPLTESKNISNPVRMRIRPRSASTTPVPGGRSDPRSVPVQEPPSHAARKHHVTDRSGPNWDENGEYIVGKGKPPKKSQWLPGQSGNPRGPKHREKVDPETELNNAILAEFGTVVNGQTVTTNLGLFAVNLMKAKAAQKDRKATEYLLDLYLKTLRARASQQSEAEISPEEQAVISSLLDAAGWDALPSIRNVRTPAGGQGLDDE